MIFSPKSNLQMSLTAENFGHAFSSPIVKSSGFLTLQESPFTYNNVLC